MGGGDLSAKQTTEILTDIKFRFTIH